MNDTARRVRESMDHRWTAAGVIALLVAVVGFVLWSDTGREADAARTGTGEEAAVEAAAELVSVPVADEAERVAADLAAESAGAQEAAAPAPEAQPRDGVTWIELEVVDELDVPVRAAEVEMDGLRLLDEPGGHFMWVGDESKAVTDRDGRARLFHPNWIGDVGEVGQVSFKIQHPDFIAYRDTSFDITGGGGKVVLKRGCFVAVSGWITDESEVITAVTPRADDDSRVRAGDWSPLADGRPATTRMPVGARTLVLTCERDEGVYHSEVLDFVLAEGEEKDLHLQLHRAVTIRGRLDEDVPRPVYDGEVMVNFVVGGERAGGRASFGRYHSAPVGLDGTFVFEHAPRGLAEIIGMCDGWVSSQVDWTGRTTWPQSFVVGAEDVEFELDMQQTSDFKGTFVDRDGAGIPGATVSFWPNVRWSNHYAQIFLNRTWTATADVSGHVEIENVPPWVDEFGFEHGGFLLPVVTLPNQEDWRNGRRFGFVTFRPGEVFEKTFVCEPKSDDD